MKILKIEFKNINSLQGEHEIDFRNAPFFGNNLFAITGATGSGKSTILDILVLALFNQTPRYSKLSKKEIEVNGAILTRGQKDAYARVTYECQKGEFISEWSISTNKNGNLRDSEMQVSDVLTQTSLVDKKTEVPKKNEELIGLTYDQFVKSVMLAQGDFAEFLISKKSERTLLLEKITGTDIYRNIGMKVFLKAKEINAIIDNLRNEKESWEKEILTEESFREIQEKKQILENEILKLKLDEKQYNQQIEQKNLIYSARKSLNILIEKENKILFKIKNFKENQGLKLQQHKKVEPIQNELNQWKRSQEDLAKNASKTEETGLKKINLNTLKSQFNQEIQTLLKKEIIEDDYEKELNLFEEKVTDLKQKSENQIQQGKSLKNEIEAHISQLNMKFPETNYEVVREDLISKQKTSQIFIEKNHSGKFDKTEIENKIQENRNQLEVLQNAKTDAFKISNLKIQIQENETEKQSLNSHIKDLPLQIENTEKDLNLQLSVLENLNLKSENQKLISTLEDHRNHLKAGEACPLCGALHHPFALEMPDFNEDELSIKIKEQTKITEKLKQDLSSKKTTFMLKSELFQKIEDNLKTLNYTLQKLIIQFERNYTFDLQSDWETLENKHKNEIDILQKLISYHFQLEIAEITIPKLNRMFDLLELAKETKKKMNQLYHDKILVSQKVDQMKNRWYEIISDQRMIRFQEKEIETERLNIHKTLQSLTDIIENYIEEFQISDIKSAASYLLDYHSYKELSNQFEEFNNLSKEIKLKKQHQQEDLDKLKLKDVEFSKEDLSQFLQSNLEIQKQKNKILDDYKRKIQNQKDFQEKINALDEKIKNESKNSQHWIALNTLIGDAKGAKFNNFAQDLTLLQLLHLANQRLKLLNKRYIIDNSIENEDDNLVVIDNDMGGQRRSVKTLSGGETFVLSLALALALSDLASSNVQINSLFIDEGFGTLDPETLDQTLTTLEQLQEEGSKLIGIISHVSTLKERIAAQIQIVPNGRGFSSVKILN